MCNCHVYIHLSILKKAPRCINKMFVPSEMRVNIERQIRILTDWHSRAQSDTIKLIVEASKEKRKCDQTEHALITGELGDNIRNLSRKLAHTSSSRKDKKAKVFGTLHNIDASASTQELNAFCDDAMQLQALVNKEKRLHDQLTDAITIKETAPRTLALAKTKIERLKNVIQIQHRNEEALASMLHSHRNFYKTLCTSKQWDIPFEIISRLAKLQNGCVLYRTNFALVSKDFSRAMFASGLHAGRHMLQLMGCACCNGVVFLSRTRTQLNINVGDRTATLNCLPNGLSLCRFTQMQIAPFAHGNTITFPIWRALNHDAKWAERNFGHIQLGLRIINGISMEAFFIDMPRSH